jgi:hypothetical protein
MTSSKQPRIGTQVRNPLGLPHHDDTARHRGPFAVQLEDMFLVGPSSPGTGSAVAV